MSETSSETSGETSGRLGPQPAATTEEPELRPGGVDSVDDPRYGSTFDQPTTPDPDPDANPAVEDVVPDEITAPDDKQQEPDEPAESDSAGDSDDEDAGSTSEPTA